MKHIAAFITPHGFGHTTRAIAVLEALQHRCPGLAIEIFTTVGEHLFRESLANYTVHQLVADVGIIQHDALKIDIPATIKALNMHLPYSAELIRNLAEKVEECSCILCDIAPLGIVVAEAAGIPSVLVENFTWDWIYQPHVTTYPELGRYVEMLAAIYDRATLHVQTEPVCNPSSAACTCPTIFRSAHTSTTHVLQQLGIADQKLILISLGGLGFAMPRWQRLDALNDCFFVLAGQPEYLKISSNCLALPHESGFYHPDLIQAADLAVFKSGYSTVAECLQAGTRAACIARPSFAESAVLAQFVKERLGGIILDENEFLCGRWIKRVPYMLELPAPSPAIENGADRVAGLLLSLIGT